MYRKFTFFIFLLSLCLSSCDKDKAGLSTLLKIRVTTATITENNQPVETLNFTASIDNPWPEDLVFTWSTEAGTAHPGQDFEEMTGVQAVIPAGSLSVNLPVGILGDTLMEFTEHFTIRIRNEGIQDRQTTITILNDDYIIPEWTEEGAVTSLQYPGMQLAWHDEFEGNTINTEYWNYDAPNGFPVNCGSNDGETGKYTGDTNHLKLENRRLIITATLDPVTGIYRSSRINSQEKVDIRFGRIDIRAKLAAGVGLASGMGMIGAMGEWPSGGEIEITKMAGDQPGSITAGLVYENEGARYFEKKYTLEDGYPDLTGRFHIYTLLWEENRIIWLLDYEPYLMISRQEFPGTYLFNEPFFLRVNLAVGGNFAGLPNSNTEFPANLVIDYIRVYQPLDEDASR
ncbi:MAG: family 16 glycosylhydrolase [Cyclobacteriaceae bacterium]|nr:family 16 glycosylhydrolase [Cyclobacteriaceae bacterium]